MRVHTIACAALLLVAPAAGASGQGFERLAGGVALTVGDRRVEVHVCREEVIRVLYAPPGPFFKRSSFSTVPGACRTTPFEVKTSGEAVHVTTARLTARVALPGGAVTFLDREGRTLLAEKAVGGKSMAPAQVMGEATHHVQAEFEPAPGEALYGLGAHQSGLMSYTGRDVDMYQLNTVDIVPVAGLQPRLRHPVGQHVAHEVRRPEGARAHAGEEPVRRAGAGRAA